jgi:hypothetical protein
LSWALSIAAWIRGEGADQLVVLVEQLDRQG